MKTETERETMRRFYWEGEAGVVCPFCNEPGFDRFGLKLHLQSGLCEQYEEQYCPIESREYCGYEGVQVMSECNHKEMLNRKPRPICERDAEVARLKKELEKAKEENRYLLVEAKAELEWFQRSWCDDHPMSEGGINRVHRLISRIDVALKEAGR